MNNHRIIIIKHERFNFINVKIRHVCLIFVSTTDWKKYKKMMQSANRIKYKKTTTDIVT